MNQGLVCLLIKSSGTPPPKPTVFGGTLPKVQRQVAPFKILNPRMHRAITEGSSFTTPTTPGAKPIYTPSKNELGQIATQEKYQQALYDTNKTKDPRTMYDYYKTESGPGSAADYDTVQLLDMRRQQMQDIMPANQDVTDPEVQKRLAGFKTLSAEVPGVYTKLPTTDAASVRYGLANSQQQGFDKEFYGAQQALSVLKENGASPEQIAQAQATVDKMRDVKYTSLRRVNRPTQIDPTQTDKWVTDLQTKGGEAEKAQTAAQSIPTAQAYAAEAVKNPQTALDLAEYNKKPVDMPFEPSPEIAKAIPWQNKLTMWAKDNPGLSAGILAAGGGLIALMLGRLFSGGQQQAPQVVYQQQAPMPPQEQARAGRQYNIHRLMG